MRLMTGSVRGGGVEKENQVCTVNAACFEPPQGGGGGGRGDIQRKRTL